MAKHSKAERARRAQENENVVRIEAAWRASHETIAAAAPNRWLVVAEGSQHAVPSVRPDTIVDAAVRILEQIR